MKNILTVIKNRLNLYRRYFNWRSAACIFIHVPKAAGTSINHALYGRTLGHYAIAEIAARFPGLVQKCLVFAVVRNPYDRLVSAYHFAKKGRTADMGIDNPEQYQIPAFRSFESFVLEWLVKQDLAAIDHVFRPQYLYVCRDGQLAVDYLGHVETLPDDMAVVGHRLGRPLHIEEKNVVARDGSYRDFYNAALADTVYRLYQRDFELFGYDRKL